MADVLEDAVKEGFKKGISVTCKKVTQKYSLNLSDAQKEPVRNMICDTMSYTASTLMKGKFSPLDTAMYALNTRANVNQMNGDQQRYCGYLKAAMAGYGFKIAAQAYATFNAASAGGTAGMVWGGIGGTTLFPGIGTTAGVVGGLVVGAGAPLALGSWQMYETAAKLTDAALEYHNQCGPLSRPKASTPVEPTSKLEASKWTGADEPSEAAQNTA